MGKRKLFVHVGLAKTGSTSIQRMLHRLSPSLEQLGVHVLATIAIRGNHWRLVPRRTPESPQSAEFLEVRWQILFKEVMRCRAPRLVVSAEHFASPWGVAPSVRRFAALAEAANLEIHIVACVRPQWQWLESSWTQRVEGMTALPPFGEWVDTGLEDLRLDFAQVFSPWKEAFGRVTVVPLERSQLPDGLLVRFLRILGVDDARTQAAARQMPRLNRRRGAKALEVRRLLSAAMHRHGLNLRQLRRIGRQLGALSEVFDDDPPFAGLTREGIDSIMARFASRNARFASDFGIDADGILFRDEPADGLARPTCFAWTDLTDEERLSASDFVRRRFGLQLPDGVEVKEKARKRSGQVTFAEVVAGLSDSGKPSWHATLRAVPTRPLEIVRGFGQIRFSAPGVLILEWLRWQVYAMAYYARRLWDHRR